jgi:hypothetical protein
MDERIEKAFGVANYMATLSNQRRIILEEFNQNLIYYINGGTFVVSTELIVFTKAVLDMGYDTDVQFIDANHFPILINDVSKFYETIVDIYFRSVNEYAAKFTEIKSKRKIGDIINL